MPDFAQLDLPTNAALLAAAALFVWLAGTRLSLYANAINEATGIGQAVVGLVLLAGVTSLPELAISVTSATAGDAKLAINNLFGSTAMQVTMLVVIDIYIGRRALTSVPPDPTLILLGLLNVLLLVVAAAGILVQDIPVAGAGLWAWACLAGYFGSVWILSRARGRKPWVAAPAPQPGQNAAERRERRSAELTGKLEGIPLGGLIFRTVAAGAIILVAGFVLARTGSAIAEQTGIGSSFVGFVLIAISSSLPELSSVISAARIGRLTMAISDILGTNLINVGLIFVVDAVASGEPVLNRLGTFAAFGALLSILLTTLFLIGLAERRDRTLWRLGFDSGAVLVAYVGGVMLLYTLR